MSSGRWDPQDLRVLIVAPDEIDEARILGYLEKAGFAGRVMAATSRSSATILTRERPFTLMLISERLGAAESLLLLRDVSTSQDAAQDDARTALVPFASQPDRGELLRLIEAGAHGIILPPPEPRAVRDVIRAALDAAHRPTQPRPASGQDGARLAQILERVAQKLDDIAGKMEAADGERTAFEVSPKLIQEAILGALVLSGDDASASVDRIVEFLIESGRAGRSAGRPA